MIFNIQLNLLLQLDNGNIALTSIIIDGLETYQKEKIDKIIADFKNDFENKNNISISNIQFLSNKQAEAIKLEFEEKEKFFKQEKYILILDESQIYLEEYLDELCEQQISLKPEHKDKSFILMFSLMTTNISFLIERLKKVKTFIKNNTLTKNLTFTKKVINDTINILTKINCDDYIIIGLKRLSNELDK